MTIRNYRTLSIDDFMTKLAPHTGAMTSDIIRDMRNFAAAGKDYIMIFRDVEFKVLLPDVLAYLEKTKNDFDDLGLGDPLLDSIVPPPPAKPVPPPVEPGIAAKHPKDAPKEPASKGAKREIPPEFMHRAKDNIKSAFDKEPGE